MAAKRCRPHSSVAQDEERLPAWAVQRARSAGAMGSDGIGMPHDDARRDGSGDGAESSAAPGWAVQNSQTSHAALMLWQFILLLYSLCKLSAIDI